MVIFTAAAAPSLDESAMLSEWTFSEEGSPEDLWPQEFGERMMAASRLTVPFRQQGPGGFSLVTVEFDPGFLLARHSHSSDCLYYIVEGEIVMGQRVLGPGDGFFLPQDHPYAYRVGPEGVKLLEFRHSASFDTKFHEKDMARYREKADACLTSARSEAQSRP
jgi:quercetin dioxygenase-like cupin family protein